MIVLNEIILPFSYNYSKVLQLVYIISQSMFYFYFFWLTGSALLSYYYEFYKRDDASTYFAKILLSLPLKKLNIPFVVGLIPLIVIYSLDLIWLTGPEFTAIHSWTLVKIVLFIISIFALYSYKTSFELISLLSRTITDKDSKEYISVMESNLKRHKNSSVIGIVSILISLYLLSTLSIAKLDYDPSNFRFDFFAYLFSLETFLRFVNYLFLSLSIVYLSNLFFNFSWKETELDTSSGLGDFIKLNSLKGAIFSVLVLPLFLLIELLLFPRGSLTYLVFLSSGLAVILIFIIANQLNAFNKEANNFYLKYSFFLFVIVVLAVSTRDVSALSNAIETKTVEISHQFIAYESNLKNKLNIKTVSINPEEIFTAKCSACHKFDTKLVGPPYNLVLKKYENNRDQLVKFILNPVKVDPAYPPMPAQGLIPPEAEAVADYLLKIYKENSN